MALSRADVQRAFQNSLGRGASQADEDAFFFASQDGDASDVQLYAAISNSREADLTADPVVRFYQAAFGRVPDQAGLDNATDYVRQFGATPETYQKLSDMFVMSPEFQARYGAGTVVDADYVQSLYANILGREASSAEVASYVSGANGYDTRGEVLYAISQSNEAISYANNAVNAFLLDAAEGDAVYTGPLLPDTIAPRVLISLADASLEAGQTTQVTFDFTEQVTGFDLTDVMTTRGSLSALVQSQTDPTIYTATLTAGSSGAGQIALTGAYTDAAGNVGREGEADFSVSGGGGGNPPPANRAPTAVNDSYTTNEDTVLVVPVRGVLTNDTDADGNALTASLVSGPVNGTLTLNADGSFSYTPDANYFGTDTFTYRANDGSADSALATVTLTIDSVNDAPVVTTSNQALAYTENQAPAAIDPTVSVTDVDGSNLTSATVQFTDGFVRGEDVLSLSRFAISNTVDAAGYHQITTDGYTNIFVQFDNNQGSVLIRGLDTHDHYQDVLRAVSYSNTSDDPSDAQRTVTFTASDEDSATSLGATHTIQVTPVNDAPVANPDTFRTAENTSLVITPVSLLSNDTDQDGDNLTVTNLTQPQNGTLTANPDGTFTYQPNPNFLGMDTFTYTATDGSAFSAPTTATLNVFEQETFIGASVRLQSLFPTTSDALSQSDFVVGPGVEFSGGTFDLDVDVAATQITFSYGSAGNLIFGSSGEFNGYSLSDLNDTLNDILDVSLASSIDGLTDDDLSISADGNTIFVDFSGTNVSSGQQVVLDVVFA